MSTAPVEVPTVAQVAARFGVPTDQIEGFYGAAVSQQEDECYTDNYSPALAEALYRRVGNLWGSKAHTMGILDTGADYGVQYVPQYDSTIENLEGTRRRIPVA